MMRERHLLTNLILKVIKRETAVEIDSRCQCRTQVAMPIFEINHLVQTRVLATLALQIISSQPLQHIQGLNHLLKIPLVLKSYIDHQDNAGSTLSSFTDLVVAAA